MKHIHKYERIKYDSGFQIFKCQLPDCPHWTRYELVENKSAICWRCESIFTIKKRHMKLKKMHCDACTKGKGSNVDRSIQEFMKVLGNI